MRDERVAFEAEGTLGGTTSARVLVDPDRYLTATGQKLAEATSSAVNSYIAAHPEECDIETFGGSEAVFTPVTIGRAR